MTVKKSHVRDWQRGAASVGTLTVGELPTSPPTLTAEPSLTDTLVETATTYAEDPRVNAIGVLLWSPHPDYQLFTKNDQRSLETSTGETATVDDLVSTITYQPAPLAAGTSEDASSVTAPLARAQAAGKDPGSLVGGEQPNVPGASRLPSVGTDGPPAR